MKPQHLQSHTQRNMALGTCGQSRLPVLRALRGDGVCGAEDTGERPFRKLRRELHLEGWVGFP